MKIYKQKHRIRYNLKRFNGYAFSKGSIEYCRKVNLLNRIDISFLKKLCKILSLNRSANKDRLIERIITFLLKPTKLKQKDQLMKKTIH